MTNTVDSVMEPSLTKEQEERLDKFIMKMPQDSYGAEIIMDDGDKLKQHLADELEKQRKEMQEIMEDVVAQAFGNDELAESGAQAVEDVILNEISKGL